MWLWTLSKFACPFKPLLGILVFIFQNCLGNVNIHQCQKWTKTNPQGRSSQLTCTLQSKAHGIVYPASEEWHLFSLCSFVLVITWLFCDSPIPWEHTKNLFSFYRHKSPQFSNCPKREEVDKAAEWAIREGRTSQHNSNKKSSEKNSFTSSYIEHQTQAQFFHRESINVGSIWKNILKEDI